MRRGRTLSPRAWRWLAAAFVMLTLAYCAVAPAPPPDPWSHTG
jgi:hypothetical protein